MSQPSSGSGASSRTRSIVGTAPLTPAVERALFDKQLTGKEWVHKARERLAYMLTAKKIQSAKLERVGAVASQEELDAVFGEGNWFTHAGRLFWTEEDFATQYHAVVEILDRAEPKLNRSDPASTKAFTLYRIDPNTVGFKEVPPAEVEKGTPIEPKQPPGVMEGEVVE